MKFFLSKIFPMKKPDRGKEPRSGFIKYEDVPVSFYLGGVVGVGEVEGSLMEPPLLPPGVLPPLPLLPGVDMESLGEPEGEPLGELEGELEEGSLFMEGSLFIREDSPEGLLIESPGVADPGVVAPGVVFAAGFFFIASPVFFFFSAGLVVGSA
jgi:hypothetical protein